MFRGLLSAWKELSKLSVGFGLEGSETICLTPTSSFYLKLQHLLGHQGIQSFPKTVNPASKFIYLELQHST